MTNKFPEGKFMATVKVGPKGQIVIPKEAREMFGLKAGDALLFLADKEQGIAIQPFEYAENFFKEVYKIKKEDEKE
ncbi:MAG: AbrB/MazE/SpoVT family DNA-binding domain-containing protein [Eubacteriales bacterium]